MNYERISIVQENLFYRRHQQMKEVVNNLLNV
jgi:hypothetical protein